jgi:hypothetical protein
MVFLCYQLFWYILFSLASVIQVLADYYQRNLSLSSTVHRDTAGKNRADPEPLRRRCRPEVAEGRRRSRFLG